MADMYKRIDDLLAERGITGAKMAQDLGMSRSFMTELRKGRAKSVKLETAQKIADYLGVSVAYLTTGLPANIYECPNDENPWEVELLDAFDQLDVDHQIKAVEHVQNMVAFSDELTDTKENAPTVSGERDVLDEVDVAFYGDFKELNEDEKETVRDMVRLMRQRKEKRSQ